VHTSVDLAMYLPGETVVFTEDILAISFPIR
jgi:hypothetical protein